MSIREFAEQAGMHSPDGFKLTVGHMAMFQLEKFAELVAAHKRERLIAGVEMPEPWVLRDGQTVETGLYAADQLREFAAAAVAHKREKLLDIVYGYANHLRNDEAFQEAIRARGKA